MSNGTRLKRKATAIPRPAPSKTRRPMSTELNLKNKAPVPLSLPNELVDQIGSYLDTGDIATMTRVSKTFVFSMNKQLYSSSHMKTSINDNSAHLALFTRTMICNSDLASQIYMLELGSPSQSNVFAKRDAKALNNVLKESSYIFRQAAKEAPVSSVLRDRSSNEALRDDFYALLLSRLPNLRVLTMHIGVELKDFYHVARSQSMDQVAPKIFNKLEQLSIFSVLPKNRWHLKTWSFPRVNPFKCPSFVSSLLKVPSLKTYSTDYFRPDRLPPTSITTLDMGRSDYHGHYKTTQDLSSFFFLNANQLETVVWTSSNLLDLNRTELKATVKRLKLYDSGPAYYGRRPNPFPHLETLEVHCNVLPCVESSPRVVGSLVDMMSPSLRTLVIFGLDGLRDTEDFDINDSFRAQVFKLRAAYHRFPRLGPIQFKVEIESQNAEKEELWSQVFRLLEKCCGNMPIECSISYRQG